MMKIEAKFTNPEAVHNAQNAIQSAVPSESINIQIQSFIPRTKIAQTETIKNATTAAFTGAFLGGMVGFLLSFINSNVPNSVTDLSHHSTTLTVLITIAGSLIGAVGFGIIGALTGINVPKNVPNTFKDKVPDNYLLIVEGNDRELETVAEILKQQGGQLA